MVYSLTASSQPVSWASLVARLTSPVVQWCWAGLGTHTETPHCTPLEVTLGNTRAVAELELGIFLDQANLWQAGYLVVAEWSQNSASF